MSLTGHDRILQKYWRDDDNEAVKKHEANCHGGSGGSGGSGGGIDHDDLANVTPGQHHAPVTEGPGIDVVSQTVGLGGDTILLYDSGNNPVAEFAATSAGLDAASAAAGLGDVVYIHAHSISGNHTLAAGVTYRGLGRRATVLTGQITLGASTVLQGLSVTRTANDANTLIAVVGPGTGTAYVYDCDLSALQAGAGTGYAVRVQSGGSIVARYCVFSATSADVDSNPFDRGTTTYTIYSYAGLGKCYNLWNGASNDAPPASWTEIAYDDSGWATPVQITERGNNPLTAIAGTQLVWCTALEQSHTDQCLFRHTLTLPAGERVIAATLEVNTDDCSTVYLNDTQLWDDPLPPPDGDGEYVTEHIVNPSLALFQTGDNVLAIHGKNRNPPGYGWGYAEVTYKLTVTAVADGDLIAYACEIHNADGAVSVDPRRGDRSAYDVDHYAGLHASDIEAGVSTRHLPSATGSDVGQVPTVQSDGTYELEVPSGGVILSDIETYQRFVITAHRGDINSVDGYPENTIAAFLAAARKGAHRIELDVHKTSDGTWYVMHDATVDRTTDGTGNVSAKTDAQMDALNIDGGYGYDAGRHAGLYHPPSLEAVFTALAPYGVTMQIENNSGADWDELAEFVVAQGWKQRVVLNATTQAAAQEIKGVDPDMWVMGATGETSWPEIDIVQYRYTGAAPSEATILAAAPRPVSAYVSSLDYGTYDEGDVCRDLYDRGARYFTTNDVNAALAEWRKIMALDEHIAESDPHTGYQKESEKGAANGYAELDAGGKVPTAQLGGAGADNTKFLRGDQTWQVPAGGGAHDILSATHSDVDDADTPVDGDVLTWDDGAGQWVAAQPPGAGSGAPTDAEYLTLATNATLSQERVLTPRNLLKGVDGGANGSYYLTHGLKHKTSSDTPDDDFDSGSLDVKWTVIAGSAEAINFLQSADCARYDLSTRSGHLLLQAKNGNVKLRQDYTLPDGHSIVMAFSPAVTCSGETGIADNEINVVLALNDDDANEDAGRRAKIRWDANTDGWHNLVQWYNGATNTFKSDTRHLGDLHPTDLAARLYYRIARSGTTYYAFYSRDGETWNPLGYVDVGGVLNNVWIVLTATSSVDAPVPIQAVDWIRQGGNGLDPW